MPYFFIIVHTTTHRMSCVRHFDMYSMDAGYQYFQKMVDKGMANVVFFNCMMISMMSPTFKEYKEVGFNSWKIETIKEPWSIERGDG